MKLRLCNRDEIFVIDLDAALYFKAEDHYTSVYYGKDVKQLLPFGLFQLEDAIAGKEGCDDFYRAGRSHLVNMSKVVHASVAKETVTMLANNEQFVTVHVSKCVVKDIVRSIRDEGKTTSVGRKSYGGGNICRTLA